MNALAHRLMVLRFLGSRGLPLGEIAQGVSRAPSTVHRHLQLLRGEGLVTSRRSGRCTLYAWTSRRVFVGHKRVIT